MNADEVRRRNWVLVPMGGPVIIPAYPKRIKGITKFGEFDFTEPTYPEDHIVLAKHCSGVPLTGEILLKAGFFESYAYLNTQYKMRVTWLNGSDIRLEFFILEEHEGKFASEHCFNRIILYVHQLQNLYFALTGQELEINL